MDAKSTDFEIKITVKPSEYLRTSERVTEFYLTFPKSLPPPKVWTSVPFRISLANQSAGSLQSI